MPQNYFIIATKTISSEVHLFDYRNHPFKPPLDGKCSPDLRLRGHSDEGFGLSWSNFRQGLLLSGSRDANICLWDVNGTPKNKALDAMQIYKVNEDAVQDVAWHSRHESLFGSCGDDRNLHIWDIRSSCFTAPVQTLLAHESEMNCLAFNPFSDWIVATGSIDKTVKLFDLRKLTATLHTLESHKRGVNQIGWSPHHQEILASACDGKRVMVWDLNRINERQTPLEAEGGPPELLFIHGGHTECVVDLSWNPCEDWTIASVANDNMMQMWKLAEHIYRSDMGTNEPPEHAKGG